MLTNDRIIKAINDKEIEIAVAFGLEKGNPILYESEKSILITSLKENLYSDRLKLTLGPIIKVLNKKKVKSRYRFKSTCDCYDLRKSDNKYIINPGETIVILTNEKIKLNGKYACLIVPRISMSEVGIVVTTAYVDPYYNGLLRLHLSNMSDKAFELKFLEVVAQCFFFELSDFVSETFLENFSVKSVFFGQTWQGILSSDRNPFPIKKESANIDKLSNVKNQLNIIWSFVKKHSIIFLIITNLIIILSGLAAFQEEFKSYTTAMSQIEDSLEPTISEIIINPGEIYGEKEVTVRLSKSDIVSVLCNNDDIHYRIISGDVENESKIIFSVVTASPMTNQHEVNFSYVIVRRIK